MAPMVVLVGPPGAGKTTVGAVLAEQLGVSLRDTDADIESTAGMPIPDIFVDEGEAGFRAREVTAVRAGLAEHDGVLAVGGGAVESDEIRELLAHVFVANLTISANDAAKRVGISGPRPMLLGNVRTRWNEMMHRRAPLYDQVATITVATDDRPPTQVAADIRSAMDEESI